MKEHYSKDFVSLCGKTIRFVRHLSKEELVRCGWEWEQPENSTCIEFTDGTYAILTSDPEGNGSGYMEIDSYTPIR